MSLWSGYCPVDGDPGISCEREKTVCNHFDDSWYLNFHSCNIDVILQKLHPFSLESVAP